VSFCLWFFVGLFSLLLSRISWQRQKCFYIHICTQVYMYTYSNWKNKKTIATERGCFSCRFIICKLVQKNSNYYFVLLFFFTAWSVQASGTLFFYIQVLIFLFFLFPFVSYPYCFEQVIFFSLVTPVFLCKWYQFYFCTSLPSEYWVDSPSLVLVDDRGKEKHEEKKYLNSKKKKLGSYSIFWP